MPFMRVSPSWHTGTLSGPLITLEIWGTAEVVIKVEAFVKAIANKVTTRNITTHETFITRRLWRNNGWCVVDSFRPWTICVQSAIQCWRIILLRNKTVYYKNSTTHIYSKFHIYLFSRYDVHYLTTVRTCQLYTNYS